MPWDTIKESYELEYGTDSLEMHADGVQEGQRVLIVDDLLATGGTANAAVRLVQRLGGEIVGLAFMVELGALGGRKKLENVDDVFALVTY